MTQEQPPANRRGDPKYTWDDTVAAVGKDFSGGKDHIGQETIAYTDVVRYCEVWEFGNLLYWDEAVAKQAGYRDVVVPWSAIKQTFTYNSSWRPGEPTRFPTPDLHVTAQSPAQDEEEQLPMPPTTQGVVTNMVIEFFEPVCVGDRITIKGSKLVSVRPRKTRIGDGAFIDRERGFYNQRGELVARTVQGGYSYNPA